jgi:hypothetical protein
LFLEVAAMILTMFLAEMAFESIVNDLKLEFFSRQLTIRGETESEIPQFARLQLSTVSFADKTSKNNRH